MSRPTIKDVAARAQVSLKTVSRVINDESGVHASTREKVKRAVDELGYQPDSSARSLRTAQSYAIGLFSGAVPCCRVISLPCLTFP